MTLPHNLSTFWSQIVPAGKDAFLEGPNDKVITITNAVIPDVQNDTPKEAVRLFATVNTLRLDEEEEEKAEESTNDKEDNFYITDETLIASLVPFTHENQELSIVFTTANIVKFHNKGKLDVHLSGYIVDYYDDNFDEYEYVDEEEEAAEKKEEEPENPDEPLTPDLIQNRLAKAAKAMGPRQIQKKKQNKGNKHKRKHRNEEEESKEKAEE
ncbi:hypothetical protein TVAG_235240 [Trichomonas vaginalis G3]|uniref:Nucleoplasmin-like domain-containing protein n=1 Tax=Trichomonas vaginalis (strain ATCC PRA-98 / G3) TaxID=412133 RepID=A2DPP2_TRIV3|nr:32 kDa heat shock protein-related family [Trichomonas vaginalis G3]EAY17642.1 hypothetical protein TVAG_235240 [Trichomonas vaginalis G3]KAI5486114.1 32 kDa heat shock protein-related family [Trichomonas vaginalis G3]|eukprot:XP_001329777.1 hypothetical protein [Trichomonas vaginalis G3]